jgi:hypothetical protein
MRDLRGPQGREESLMKRATNRKRHRPEEVVAKLRQWCAAQFPETQVWVVFPRIPRRSTGIRTG